MYVGGRRSLVALGIAPLVVVVASALLTVTTRADAAGEICSGSITPQTHTILRAATRNGSGAAVSHQCHDFKTRRVELKYDTRRDLYVTTVAGFSHVNRWDVDDIYSFWIEIDRKGEIVSFRDEVATLHFRPHLFDGDWKPAARAMARHIADFLARDVQHAAAQCKRREETIVVGEGSLGVRTVRDQRDQCRLDVPALPRDYRTE